MPLRINQTIKNIITRNFKKTKDIAYEAINNGFKADHEMDINEISEELVNAIFSPDEDELKEEAAEKVFNILTDAIADIAKKKDHNFEDLALERYLHTLGKVFKFPEVTIEEIEDSILENNQDN